MCDSCDYEEYLEKIEELTEECKLAKSTRCFVEGVFEWVEEHRHITPEQMSRIDQIWDKNM